MNNRKLDELNMEHIDWDTEFMLISYVTAMRSKDPSTQVGRVIVSEDKRILSTGYNGLTTGMEDVEENWRPENYSDKYYFAEHAERNAIYNATKRGVQLKGATLYLPWIPCADCMRAIIQSGIKEVVMHRKHPGLVKENGWENSNKASIKMANRANVKMRKWDGVLPNVKIRFSGKTYENNNGEVKEQIK